MYTGKYTLKEIQQALKEFGYYQGKIDGDFGRNSKKALRAFQRMHLLTIDGIIGQQTLKYLFPVSIPEREEYAPICQVSDKFPIETKYQEELFDYYGGIGENQTKILLPYKMKLAWDKRVKIRKITCHKKIADSLEAIFKDTLDTYGLSGVKDLGLDLFGGCLNVRKMRGADRYSLHSWGIAVDIDPQHNQLRWGSNRARLSNIEYSPFWNIVESHGATSLGRTAGYDWMHFQFAKR